MRVWEGKKMRAMMPGRFRQASIAKAVWINEGMVEFNGYWRWLNKTERTTRMLV